MSTYFEALKKDKKNEGSLIKVILTHGVGQMFKTTLPLDKGMLNLIENYFQNKLWSESL